LARLKAAKERGASGPAQHATATVTPPVPAAAPPATKRESKRNALAMLKATNLKAMRSLSGGSKAMHTALRSAAGGVAGGSKKLSLSLAEGAKRMSNTSNSLATKLAVLKVCNAPFSHIRLDLLLKHRSQHTSTVLATRLHRAHTSCLLPPRLCFTPHTKHTPLRPLAHTTV
jgi:hypothetical protein